MEDTKICKGFRFDKKGTTKNATFSGPVVAFDDGFLLVPKSMQSENAGAMAAMFGLVGMLLASLFSSVKNVQFPYPTVTYGELGRLFPGVGGLGKLKAHQRIVVVRRDQVLGYKSSFWTGIQLLCTGENIALIGSKKKILSSLADFGYQQHTDPS